ncbi:MAG: hypothetical protein U0350_25120 [Caldilineaceae bacterium]
MSKPILRSDRSYAFADYFELNYPTEDIVAELGYQYTLTQLMLPVGQIDANTEPLKAKFYKQLPHVSLTSETARREVLVAPILLELLDYLTLKIDIEYPVYVNERLKGNIDYLVRSTDAFVVVEAKKADMEKGFTQLAVELIAMDQYMDMADDPIYGAVTVGDLWRFGVLRRQAKLIEKDIESFRVPADLDALFQVLVGILQPASNKQPN